MRSLRMRVNFWTRTVESGEREKARLLEAVRERSSRTLVRSSCSRWASVSEMLGSGWRPEFLSLVSLSFGENVSCLMISKN